MKSLWWIPCLLLISPLLAESDSVTIQSQFGGLGAKGQYRELQNQTLRFRCSPSIETSRSERCRQVAAVVAAAKTAAREKPSNWLGITRGWLAANVDQAINEDLKNLQGFDRPPTASQIALFRRAFLDPQTLAGVEVVHLDGGPSVHIKVKSRKTKIEFYSTTLEPFMVPWAVRLGSEMFEAHDRSIGEALCPLLPEEFPNRNRVCGTYLRNEYSDRVFAAIYDRWKSAK